MTAVMARLRPTTEAYGRLEQWTTAQGEDFSALFPALLHLIPHPQTTQERLQQIGRFFAGGRLGLATVKQWLRESGAGKLFPLKPLKEAELARQRLYFLPRLIAAAGFRGWCILFDEAELIGRYGIIQRGRSYAELARWLGADRTVEIPGLVSVVAFTDDFTEAVIVDRRDEEIVPTRLLARGDRALAVLATTGMDVIRNEQILLRPPDAIVLQATLEKTRALYAGAYGWPPPATPIGQRMAAKSMRQYIKSWITEWDLRRLYGRAGDIDSDTIVTSYAEDPAIEQPTEEPGEATEA
jgi:hypothetical protein